MKFRRQSRPDVSIDLTSLIDVVFMLLIFFMVSTTFERGAEIGIELPEASAKAPPPDERAVIEILIDEKGRYFIDGQELINTQVETLKRALGKAAQERSDPHIILSADRQAPMQAVVTAMDAARQMGFPRFAISTHEGSE